MKDKEEKKLVKKYTTYLEVILLVIGYLVQNFGGAISSVFIGAIVSFFFRKTWKKKPEFDFKLLVLPLLTSLFFLFLYYFLLF